MYRTWVITRHTFREAIVQPIYPLLLALGTMVLAIYAMLPFFTLGEDTIMFKSVGLDVIMLLVLIVTLFATSRSIFEEIEDRTMLTLMSKPVKRWEVLVGKYLGIILAALLAVACLGIVLCVCTWWRIPQDNMMVANSIDDQVRSALLNMRVMQLIGLGFALLQLWLEISALAAVGVALSTRFSLVVNLPAVILVYIAGNLTRFIHPAAASGEGHLWIVNGIAFLSRLLLPYLEAFDVKALVVVAPLRFGNLYAHDPNAVALGQVWRYLAVSAGYGLCYIVFALSVGMWLFTGRELGGAEG